ncbi:response regulator [Arsenicicoccus dermatophilus]|uniref:response regulator n=1 Tax=Arsenicicoccus dermatophilus TaxID=1076331 RepID=UPI0038926659
MTPPDPASPEAPAADPGGNAPLPPVRLLLVDDDALVRAGLRLMLGGDPTLEIVGEAGDGVDAEQQVRALRPDVVLMDIRMPRQDGLVTTEHLATQPDRPAIIVLTTFHADELVLRALRAGAGGYLLKDTPPAQIVQAIHRVRAGEPMLSPSVTQQLIAAVAEQTTDPRAARATDLVRTLTPREREIALAVAQGRTNADIAATMYLSVATVKSHVTHLLVKLEADNRVQIAIRMHDAGLV